MLFRSTASRAFSFGFPSSFLLVLFVLELPLLLLLSITSLFPLPSEEEEEDEDASSLGWSFVIVPSTKRKKGRKKDGGNGDAGVWNSVNAEGRAQASIRVGRSGAQEHRRLQTAFPNHPHFPRPQRYTLSLPPFFFTLLPLLRFCSIKSMCCCHSHL